MHPYFKSNWFSLLLASILLVVSAAKYRNGLIPIEGIDFSIPYACTRAWLAGTNPYDFDNLKREFESAGGDLPGFRVDYMPPIYPPPSFIVMIPLSLLPWDTALRVWEVSAYVLVLLMFVAMLKLAGIKFWQPRTLLLLLLVVAFAPLRSAITLTQSALPAICLVTFAMLALHYRFDAVAGCLLALAVGFKPHDALFGLVYFFVIRRWRALTWCGGLLTLMGLIAILRMGPLNMGWTLDVFNWIKLASQPGSIIDPSSGNPARFQMIQLPVLLFTMISDPRTVMIANWVICGLLLLTVAGLIYRNTRLQPNPSPDLLSISLLAAVFLLPFYHRFPDAMLLLLAGAWAVGRLNTSEQLWGRVTLILLLPFLIDPGAITSSLANSKKIAEEIHKAWWWQCFVRALSIWIILLLSVWLIIPLSHKKSPIPSANPA